MLSVGVVIKYNLLDANLQKNFLKIFNLGKPDILKTNFVSNLKKINKNKGKIVTKCINKKLGLSLLIYFFKEKKHLKNIYK